MATIKEQLESIGDAIRLKTGGTALLSLEEMAQELNNIPEKSAQDLAFSGSSVIVPAGNYKEQAVKEIATSELNKPTITVNSNGKITATVTQEEGYIAADNPGEAIVKTSDYQLPTKAAQTITPGKTNITIAANTYLTGVQTIKGDSNLVASNIVSGKTIFGVAGSFNSVDAVLNFKVIGGTTRPTSPANNTIWVNTSTTITSWDFSSSQPERRSGNKNLIVYPYNTSSYTANGITFTANSNGTITASGTATAQTTLYLHNNEDCLSLPAGAYCLSGASSSGSSSTYIIGIKYSYDNWATASYTSTGDTPTSKSVTFTDPVKLIIYLQVKSGVKCNNVVFSPQLEKGTSATSFVAGNAQGQVWINVDTSSDLSFNALKTNAIQLYPTEVYQYYNAKWNKMTVECYQDKAWKSLLSELYLFNNGDTCDSSTGGWTAASGGSVGTTLDVANGGTGPTYIQYAQVITNKAIDFSQFNTLHINVSSYSSTGTVTISTTSGGSAAASVTINAKKEFTLNIADCDDAYFIKLRTEGKQHNSNSWLSTGFYADKIWLTKD